MAKRRDVKSEILEGAIELFGLYGFEGTKTSALRDHVDLSERLIFTWYKTKDNLFLEAVTAAIGHAGQGFTAFFGKVFAESGKPNSSRIEEGIRAWLAAIPRASARLLLEVLKSEHQLNGAVRGALDQFSNALVTVLTVAPGHKKITKFKSEAAIDILLWRKALEGKHADKRIEEVLEMLGLPISE